jgi:hypothetical protein
MPIGGLRFFRYSLEVCFLFFEMPGMNESPCAVFVLPQLAII